MDVDWKNLLDRKEFEKVLQDHKNRRLEWNFGQKALWVVQIFVVQLLVVAALYGGCAYNMVNNEIDFKEQEEAKMMAGWILKGEEVGS